MHVLYTLQNLQGTHLVITLGPVILYKFDILQKKNLAQTFQICKVVYCLFSNCEHIWGFPLYFDTASAITHDSDK